MQEEGQGRAAKAMACAAKDTNVTVVTDADYRSLFLPCDALEENAGPAQLTGPLSTGGKVTSRAAGR